VSDPFHFPPRFTRVSSQWTFDDHLGAWRCRWGRFRDRYAVVPGLYALSQPDARSPVFVTGSYKLTFDTLRRDLANTACWILVLDTGGRNVASAVAGGLLAAEELVLRVQKARLAEVVEHRALVLPGLASTAVSAELVKKHTGFDVHFGPLRSEDLPAFLAAGLQATAAMLAARFPLRDRLAVVPMELERSLKRAAWFVFAAVIYAGLGPGGISLDRVATGVWPLLALGAGSVLAGSVLAPLFPFIPLRVYFLRGWVAGAAVTAALLQGARLASGMNPYLLTGSYLFFPAAGAFFSMSFAGSTPFADEPQGRTPARVACVVLAILGIVAFLISKLRQLGVL
jgi:hypothetical protein